LASQITTAPMDAHTGEGQRAPKNAWDMLETEKKKLRGGRRERGVLKGKKKKKESWTDRRE